MMVTGGKVLTNWKLLITAGQLWLNRGWMEWLFSLLRTTGHPALTTINSSYSSQQGIYGRWILCRQCNCDLQDWNLTKE